MISKMKYLLLLCLLLSCSTISVLGIADLDNKYPDVDGAVGVSYVLYRFENVGSYARFGPFVAADLNSDLTRPDWGSLGIVLSREIQRNVIIGGGIGYRFGQTEGTQYMFFIGIDVWPLLKVGK